MKVNKKGITIVKNQREKTTAFYSPCCLYIIDCYYTVLITTFMTTL